MGKVEATIVVKFGEGVEGDALALIELDETENTYVDDSGEVQVKTQFNPGEEPFFWIHYDSSLKVAEYRSSAGEIELQQLSRTYNKEQQLQFIKEKIDSDTAEQELSYYPMQTSSPSWYGNEGEGWKRTGRKITVSGNTPCICDLDFTIKADQYKLIPPSMTLAEDETYPILVVFYMENA